MSRSKRLLVFPLFALLWSPPHLVFAQTPVPVWAELVQRLDASKVKVGDPILAKLALAWKSPACDLRTGAIIQGRVVNQKAHSKTEKTSEIGVIFEGGQCGGREMKPLFLTVAAVVAPYPSRYSDIPDTAEEMQPLSSAVGLTLNGNMRSISQASETTFFEPRRAKAASTVMPGQVVGIPHVAISVGQGAGGASILSSSGYNVQLSPGTQFVLVPNLKAGSNEDSKARPDTAPRNPVREVTEPPPPTIADERELCAAPDCTVELADSQLDRGIQSTQVTVPLKGLGYLPPSSDREMSGFDYDTSIAYLGPTQFLFSFNPHILVPRSGFRSKFLPQDSDRARRAHRPGDKRNRKDCRLARSRLWPLSMADWREPGLDSRRPGVARLRPRTSAAQPDFPRRAIGVCADFPGVGILRRGHYSRAALARHPSTA